MIYVDTTAHAALLLHGALAAKFVNEYHVLDIGTAYEQFSENLRSAGTRAHRQSSPSDTPQDHVAAANPGDLALTATPNPILSPMVNG